MKYGCRPQFEGFHARDKRWAILVCHRRAGKTVACVNDLINFAIWTKKRHARYAYIAPYYSQAKQVAWSYLKEYAAEYLLEEPRESELSVTLKTGAKVRLYGADNPNALRGLYFDGVVLDEFADMKPALWSEVVRPALADRKGWAVFIGTPKGKNEFWEIWDRATHAERELWYSLMLKSSETRILPEAELADARRSMTEDKYAQEFECSFEAAIQGAVYGVWIRQATEQGRITSVAYDDKLPVHTAWDLGFDDSTAIWFWQITFGEIRLIDYYETSGHGIPHYVEFLKAKPYKYGNHWVPHDAMHELMAASGRSIVSQAKELGVQLNVVPPIAQQNSIEAARKTLERSWFDATKCNRGIEALKNYQFEFDEEKKTFKSRPRHDWSSHGSDAFEIIAEVWKTPESEKPKPKPRFLEEMTADEVFFPKDRKRLTGERI